MSFLTLPSLKLADIGKGTISLWFRFSKDSVDKAKEYQSPRPFVGNPDVLDFTIPLVTFGRKVMAHVYDTKTVAFTEDPPPPPPFVPFVAYVPNVDPKDDAPCPPSHIGILCGERTGLVMNFQTETRAQVQGLVHQIVDMKNLTTPFETITVEDISYVRTASPESFRIEPGFKVAVDKWHHLLVSFDFSNSVDVIPVETPAGTTVGDNSALRSAVIQSYCKVWYAFDDENKKGKDNVGRVAIPPESEGGSPTVGWVPQNDNGIIPQNAESAVFEYSPGRFAENTTGGTENPEYHWQASPLPMMNGPMGFPASAEYVETVYHCEMAEFQFFAGITLDTGIELNRRAFVDKDGKPVPATKKKDPEDPASTSGSIELLGKEPEILLHGSGNWKKGKNTGTLGFEINSAGVPQLIPAGQFTPTGGIEKYKPEPHLTETPTA